MNKKGDKDIYRKTWDTILEREEKIGTINETSFSDYYDALQAVADTAVIDNDIVNAIMYMKVHRGSHKFRKNVSDPVRYEMNDTITPEAVGYQLWNTLLNGTNTHIRDSNNGNMSKAMTKALETIVDMPEFTEMAKVTSLNTAFSSMATMTMMPIMYELVEKYIEHEQKNNGKGGDGDRGEGGGDKVANCMIPKISMVLKNAKDNLEDKIGNARSFGMEPPSDPMADPSAYIEAADNLGREHVKKIAESIGAMDRAIDTSVGNIVRSSMGYSRVSFGDDLSAIPKYEYLRLSSEEMEDILLMDIISGEAPQHHNEVPIGSGHIVICIDISGSMCGEPDIMARSLAFSTVKAAKKSNRHVSVILFNTAIKQFSMDCITDVSKMLDVGPSGGTCFDKPLTEAFGICKRKNKLNTSSRTDVLFITDGECCIDDVGKIDRLKKEANAKLFSIFIGSSMDYVSGSDLTRVSDEVSGVTSMAEIGKDATAMTSFWKSVLKAA